ncbi:MAG TPA: glycosyltransferase family 4 protein [Tepidisphaeraceae bacterium]|jgi:glycosyltransferase involved in cell wall biosynthesis|nr:glycosyltransferase family 4 protein [Tepidisphaeraceae bacterium]
MPLPLRILYAAGPGDVIGTYRHWKEGRDDPSQVAATYSGQFYSLCRELGARGYIISYCPRVEILRDGPFWLEHRPVRFAKGPGALYHLAQVWYGLRLTLSAVRFGANVAVISGGAHWFSLGLLPMLGVKVVPTLHCVLWRKGRPPAGKVGRAIQRLNSRFFRKRTAGVLSLSKDISDQLAELLQGERKAVVPFLPNYRPQSFEGMSDAAASPPFRVFFAGRIERNKGVFDLLEIARRFAAEERNDIEFDLCGDGSALAELRQAITSAGVGERFRCHGHSDKSTMRQMYSAAHTVIAPTTSDFIEGFNKVVAEGVLAGKPVITSSVCPALEYVRDAVVEVPVNDVKAYGDAIIRLREDAGFYQEKVRGCAAAQQQFYDADRGWGAALKQMLRLIDPSDRPCAESTAGRPVPAE